MYKISFFLILFLSFISLQAQDFKVKLSQDVCDCFSKSDKKQDALEACFTNNIINYQADLEKLIDKNSEISQYEQGQQLGVKVFFEMQQALIQNCDDYFEYFDRLRNESFEDMQKNYGPDNIASLDFQISKNRTAELLWERGNAYFASSNFNKAKTSYQESLQLDPNYIQSVFFLGWVNEKAGDYNRAIKLYQQVLRRTGKQEIILFIELARRKSGN